MDNRVLSVAFILSIAILLHSAASHNHNIQSPCDQTPYPQVCQSFLLTTNKDLTVSSASNNSFQQTRLELNDLALSVTLNQAVETQALISSMDLTILNQRARMAWDDCVELYHDTIELLNQSLLLNHNSLTRTVVDHDLPTYLSAAITNQETCKDGFADVNVTNHLESSFPLPLMSNNFSMMLSNTLALHTATTPLSSSTTHGRRLLDDGFPSWISAEVRRVLKKDDEKQTSVVDNIVVAKDGSGNYMTIMEAIAAAVKLRKRTKRRLVIHVRGGVYEENVEIKKSLRNLMMVGDGIDVTVVTGKKSVAGGFTTFRSATFAVKGDGFIAKDMTFENTAGPQNHQAVSLRSGSDFSVFYRCSFKGYQDTLYLYSKRQFYRDCDIYGTIDFIFGDAAAVLQNCNIYVRKPMPNQKNTVTAQARSDPNENTGIVIQNSRITTASDLRGGSTPSPFPDTYLGRPWKKYSRAVIMTTFIDGLVNPLGWTPWSGGGFGLDTVYYGEYLNSGPGSNTAGRVNWRGYHVFTNPNEAAEFTASEMLSGDSWIPATGVPYLGGL